MRAAALVQQPDFTFSLLEKKKFCKKKKLLWGCTPHARATFGKVNKKSHKIGANI